jgi:hypothetical protein
MEEVVVVDIMLHHLQQNQEEEVQSMEVVVADVEHV